eukprot:g19348.t1
MTASFRPARDMELLKMTRRLVTVHCGLTLDGSFLRVAAQALGIAELERLARRLGCSQSAILQAAGIDLSVAAALPEDMRSSVVMAEVSQVSLDHLRQTPQAPHAAQQAGSADIDAVVLEALPPDIREEVLREEAARNRRAPQSNEMDNASFIASLDPLLREEVLLSAPEEVLRTLPAELVAEAQLLRDRAFTRIALRRDVPGVGRLPIGVPPQAPQESCASTITGLATSACTFANDRAAVATPQQRQCAKMEWAYWNAAPCCSQFQPLPRLRHTDLDEGVEVPISPSVIPSVCRLLYLRTEVSTIPMTRLCFNLTRSALLGHFLILLCKRTEADAPMDALPPPCLFEASDGKAYRSPLEVQSVGSQRILAILAYLLRRVPQCGEFFARKLAHEAWMSGFQSPKLSPDRSKKARVDQVLMPGNLPIAQLPGICSVNLLMQLVNTRLYLSSSRHAAWLLSVLHALLAERQAERQDRCPARLRRPPCPQPQLQWTKIIKDMHMSLSQESVLALCHFLCHAGSGHGSSSEGDAFQLAGEILVALAARQHLDIVRSELMKVLSSLVTDIEKALESEGSSSEPSTVESRFLRVVKTLTEVFREAKISEVKLDAFEEARVEMLWTALDKSLERLDDAEVSATPAQKLLSSTPRPETDATQSSPPKLGSFFVLHGRAEEGDARSEANRPTMTEGGSASSQPAKAPKHVFAEFHEQSAAEKSRFGQNALLKQTPSLLSKSFQPVLQLMPSCLDFDNKRAYFRSQLRSRRLESRYQTIRLRVRRNEIFMDSYHQLRVRTGDEMRAKIQVQFQGEEGIDAGGVAKDGHWAKSREMRDVDFQ